MKKVANLIINPVKYYKYLSASGMSQLEFLRAAGIGYETLRKALNGECLSRNTLNAIAYAFNTTVESITMRPQDLPVTKNQNDETQVPEENDAVIGKNTALQIQLILKEVKLQTALLQRLVDAWEK